MCWCEINMHAPFHLKDEGLRKCISIHNLTLFRLLNCPRVLIWSFFMMMGLFLDCWWWEMWGCGRECKKEESYDPVQNEEKWMVTWMKWVRVLTQKHLRKEFLLSGHMHEKRINSSSDCGWWKMNLIISTSSP